MKVLEAFLFRRLVFMAINSKRGSWERKPAKPLRVTEEAVFTENNSTSPVLDTGKKILANVTDKDWDRIAHRIKTRGE